MGPIKLEMYDTYGRELLNERLSLTLTDLRIQSYLYNKEIAEEVFVLYLKFDIWMRIFFDDGVLFIKEGPEEPLMNLENESDADEFEYPFIDSINEKYPIDKVLNKSFVGFTVSQGFDLYLDFQGGHQMKISQEVTSPGWFGRTTLEIK
ncbi:hypothetical protein D770_04335 [Flammeovirgaceae bacterium 311]|nr:hypothetical protein D770_04335 [Flammeovirgaceae bacterium 311]